MRALRMAQAEATAKDKVLLNRHPQTALTFLYDSAYAHHEI